MDESYQICSYMFIYFPHWCQSHPLDVISQPKTCCQASLRSSILLCWRQRFSKSDSTSCRACDASIYAAEVTNQWVKTMEFETHLSNKKVYMGYEPPSPKNEGNDDAPWDFGQERRAPTTPNCCDTRFWKAAGAMHRQWLTDSVHQLGLMIYRGNS